MMIALHKQARTTPAVRAELAGSSESVTVLARRFNVTPATVYKWKSRQSVHDRSHTAHTFQTTLTPVQETVVVELRRTLLLPLDDLLAVTREFLCKEVSRSGLDRCLRRHGVGNLNALKPSAPKEPHKAFKSCTPGYLHMDVKYLPQMPDEAHRRYLFVAIDRATRWVYMRSYSDQTETSSTDFLRRLKQAAPMKIKSILTDNGSQFTDRFTQASRTPTGQHAFDLTCLSMGIEHRLCPPRHPQTNGMVERFNGRISELVQQTRFTSAAELDRTLTRYLSTYNLLIPQRALKHKTPVEALRKWQHDRPELFSKKVYKQPGLDTYPSKPHSNGRSRSRQGRPTKGRADPIKG